MSLACVRGATIAAVPGYRAWRDIRTGAPAVDRPAARLAVSA